MTKEILSKDLVIGNSYYDIDPTVDNTASKLVFHSYDVNENLIAFELLEDSNLYLKEDNLVKFEYEPDDIWFELE